MKRKNNSAITMGVVVLIFVLGGCASIDVVGKIAKTSFNAVLEASKDKVSITKDDAAWALVSSAGDAILFSTNFARDASNENGFADVGQSDVEFIFDAAPFISAGLDVTKLLATDGIKYQIKDGRFMIYFELGDHTFTADAVKSFEGTFSEIVRTQRSRIGYHEKLDHYGINLGDGNMFEWAKDMSKNDKDIVWVLNPAPFIAAGVNPEKISGWVFAKVETKDEKGKIVLIDKLLKPINLK